MVPGSFTFLPVLPRTPSGKLEREALPSPEALRSRASEGYVAPRTEIERVLVAVWQEVLNVEMVGTQDNFFDLGGHSLLMARVHGRLVQLLNRDLSMLDLFRFPTVSSLARHLSQTGRGQLEEQQIRERAEKQRTTIGRHTRGTNDGR
jgi:hypothetical protein